MSRSGRGRARAGLAAASVTVVAIAVGLPLVGSGTPEAAPAETVADLGPVASAAERSTPSASPPAETATPVPRFDRDRLSVDDASSPWVVVNKARPVQPIDYAPRTVEVRGYRVATAAAGPLTRMLQAGERRGLGLELASAYRSYDYQRGVFDETVGRLGRAGAELRSARPGHSEHQTGLAVDVVDPDAPQCDFDACFASTAGGRWVARTAWRYGFVVRYRPGQTDITGYDPEPWHLRYVGPGLAAELRRTGTTTLEEFFDVRGGDYTAAVDGAG